MRSERLSTSLAPHLQERNDALEGVRGVGALLIEREPLDDLGASLFCERLPEVVEQIQVLPEAVGPYHAGTLVDKR